MNNPFTEHGLRQARPEIKAVEVHTDQSIVTYNRVLSVTWNSDKTVLVIYCKDREVHWLARSFNRFEIIR